MPALFLGRDELLEIQRVRAYSEDPRHWRMPDQHPCVGLRPQDPCVVRFPPSWQAIYTIDMGSYRGQVMRVRHLSISDGRGVPHPLAVALLAVALLAVAFKYGAGCDAFVMPSTGPYVMHVIEPYEVPAAAVAPDPREEDGLPRVDTRD